MAICIFAVLVLIAIIAAVVVSAAVSSIESRREDGENE